MVYRVTVVRVVMWAGLIGVLVAGIIAAYAASGFDPGIRGGDAWNYLAAGERLNAGHPLYAMSPGDRPVAIVPPYWTVPLLAPPPIAVVWRPLAAIGEPSMLLWGVLNLLATSAAAVYLLVGTSITATAIVAALAAPLSLLALSGNASGFLFALLVAAWALRRHAAVVGAILAVTIAVKLTPALLLIWVVAERRWRVLAATLVGLGVIGIGSLLGAGLQAHLDWLASVPASGPSPLALASLTGIPSPVVPVLLGIMIVAVAYRADERLTFSVAVLGSALATPAFYFPAMGMAAAAAAPWVAPRTWPRRVSTPRLASVSPHPKSGRPPVDERDPKQVPGDAEAEP